MGFRQGAIAKLWSVEDQGKYCTGNLTVSKKDEEAENGYTYTFRDGYVRFIGDAYKKAMELSDQLEKGLSIEILSCDVTNYYSVKTKKMIISYAVFDFEEVDWDKFKKKPKKKDDEEAPKTKKKKKAEPDDDEPDYEELVGEEDLPF